MSTFEINRREILGVLLIIGPFQFILAVLVAQGIAINYDASLHYVSTLGAGSTDWIFNTSVILLGFCLLLSTYLIQKEYNEKIISSLLLLTAICAIGVGIFPEGTRPLHGIFTGFVFTFSSIFLMFIFRIEKSLIPMLIAIFGLLILIFSLIFFPYLGLEVQDSTRFFGFLKGSMERFIIYANVFCFFVLGGYLSTTDAKLSSQKFL